MKMTPLPRGLFNPFLQKMLFVARHCQAKRSKTSRSIVSKSSIFLYIYHFAFVWPAIFRDRPAKSFAFLLNVFSHASPGFCKYVYVVFFLVLNILPCFLFSRVFIKILFQELAEYMGLPKLNERLKDP